MKKGMFLVVVGLLFLSLVYASTFVDDAQAEFDLGTYSNTTYNGSAVVLVGENLTGTYTSGVFDAGADATWNSLADTSSTPNVNYLFGVDGGGEVWKSTDVGVNWVLSQENYGRISDTSEMFTDSDYIYILAQSNQEVWRSSDGTSFVVVNDTFANSGLLLAEVDSSGNIYVADASGDVYVSTDDGVSWTLQGDFNGAATNNGKGMGIVSNGDIYVTDGSGAVFKSTNSGVDWTEVNSGYGGGGGTDDLEIDSNNDLYILNNDEIYKSTNSGVDWNLINASFSNYDGTRMLIDSNDNFFIGDGGGRIYQSLDSGISWTQISDMNDGASSSTWGLADFSQTSSLSYQVRNCSASDCSDASFADATLGSLNLVSQYFQYQVSFTSPDASISPQLKTVTIDYDLVNSAPTITLVEPQDGQAYGYNESLDLNFTASDVDSNLDSCWYWLDDGVNNTLAGCANITFDVSEGSHDLTIYANDSLGELSSDSVSFSVAVGAPSIQLSFPVNKYLNYQENIYFNYTPTDIDLDSCELWGDFTGTFALNQTDSSPTSGAVNSFVLNLTDGTYLWNIRCNDTLGNSAFNGNKTFYVDTVQPVVSLSEPTGTKTSLTGIEISWTINDSNLNSCWFNRTTSAGDLVGNAFNSVVCSSNSSTTFVSTPGAYILNFYVNDSAGNSNNESSSFSVDTSTSPPGGGGGGGGGGSTTIIQTSNTTLELSGETISNLIVKPGDSKTISWRVENSGTAFLNDCKLEATGGNYAWLSTGEVKNLAAGEEYDFIFELNVPESVEPGINVLGVFLVCEEASESAQFNVEIVEQKVEFEIVDVERVRDEVKVTYLLKELSGNDQRVDLQFLLYGLNEEKVAEGVDSKEIFASSEGEYSVSITIPNRLSGSYNLLINLNSDAYSTFIQEEVVLGAAVTGFAIFDGANRDWILSGAIILVFAVFAVVVVVRISSHRKKIHGKNVESRKPKKAKSVLFHMLGMKKTGGKYIARRKKKKYEIAGQKRTVKLGEDKRKTQRVKGGNKKTVMLKSKTVNVKGKDKKIQKLEIKNVLETPSNRFLARQNVLTKGTIVQTDLGKVKITNRPSQEGAINGILVE